MKKFLSMAAVAFLALVATTFASCSDDDTTTTQSETKTPVPVQFISCVTSVQTQYYDISYTIAIDGKTQEIKLSDMKELSSTDANNIELCKKAASLISAFKSSVTMKAYYYDLGQYTSGTFTIKSIHYTVKQGHPTEEGDFIVANGYNATSNIKSSITDVASYGGVAGDDASLQKFATLMEAHNTASLTLN